MGQEPIHRISLGEIQIAIWENEDKEGNKFYSVKPSRSFKNKNDEWESTTSFYAKHLLVVAIGLKQAYLWILDRKQEMKK